MIKTPSGGAPNQTPREIADLPPEPGRREPVFNLSAVVVALIGLCAAIHLVRAQFLSGEQDFALVLRLASDADHARDFFASIGEVASVSVVDGPRFTLQSGDIVHYRPSGNAPELRCYVEGATPEAASRLLHWGLEAAERALIRDATTPA